MVKARAWGAASKVRPRAPANKNARCCDRHKVSSVIAASRVSFAFNTDFTGVCSVSTSKPAQYGRMAANSKPVVARIPVARFLLHCRGDLLLSDVEHSLGGNVRCEVRCDP